MPAYVVLYTFTDQGRKDAKGTVKRAEETRAQNEQRGFNLVQVDKVGCRSRALRLSARVVRLRI